MTWEWTLPTAFNVAGALIIVLFGILVAVARAHTPQATAVSAFSIAFGAATGAINLQTVVDPETTWGQSLAWIAFAASWGWYLTLLAMWWLLPSLRLFNWRQLFLPIAFCVCGFVFATLPILSGTIPTPFIDDFGPGARFYFAFAGLSYGLWWALIMLLATRFSGDDAHASRTPLLAGALALYPASGTSAVFNADAGIARIGWVDLMLAVTIAGAWLMAGHRAQRPRPARAVAWTILGAALVGLIDGVAGGISGGFGIQGLARILTVALLSYAILRHRLLGIDVKVRWGISRGTVAAAFVAAFFVASEAAQQFFGESLGSAYVGIVAAGALVFAIAPLQRVAERLAEKAVPAPINSPRARAASDAQEAAYQVAVRLALRGGITHTEELDLARIAEAHGLPQVRARELRNAIEDRWEREGRS